METLTSVSSGLSTPQSTFNSKNTQLVSYEQETINFDYKNKDGDTVSLNYTKVSAALYNKSGAMNSNGQAGSSAAVLSPEEAQKLRAKLKTELYAYKEALVKSFVEANGGKYTPVTDPNSAQSDQQVSDLEAKMPDYWSAENTSQRIVDFATSFLSSFKGDSSEFFKTIKSAIETGFKQAKDLLGDLPGATGNLISKTYKLTMDKLAAYEQQNAGPGQGQPAQTPPADQTDVSAKAAA
jgi:hypothetical protein